MTEPFQVSLASDPFRMLVACVLVNRTRWSQAKPVFDEIFRRWPTVNDLAAARVSDLTDVVRPLGMWNARALNLVCMAMAWVYGQRCVMKLPGCGKYAADSYAIFVEGRRDVEPTDRVLRAWLEREEAAV